MIPNTWSQLVLCVVDDCELTTLLSPSNSETLCPLSIFRWTHMRYRPGYTPLYLIIRLPQSAVKYHEISRNIMWYHERLWKIVRHAMWLDAVGSITWRMGGDHHGDHNFAAMGDQAIPWVSLANLLKGFNYVMQKIGSNIDPNFLPPKLIKVVT